MRQGFLILVFALLGAVMANAQIDTNDNGIGIYADVGGMTNQVEVEAGVPMEAYVLVTNPQGTRQFAGLEFLIDVPDNVSIWGWNTPMTGAMVLSAAPDFWIVFTPQDYQAVHHVMTIIIVPEDTEPAQFYIRASQQPGSGDAPRFLDMGWDSGDGEELIDLTPYPGGCDNMTFVLNGAIVPNEATSWSDVKALYR